MGIRTKMRRTLPEGACSKRLSVLLPANTAQSSRPGLEAIAQQRQDRIVAQIVVVIDVFITERDAGDPLSHHGSHLKVVLQRSVAERGLDISCEKVRR